MSDITWIGFTWITVIDNKINNSEYFRLANTWLSVYPIILEFVTILLEQPKSWGSFLA